MLFSPRIRLQPLAQLCRRLATATAAGLEDRRIWKDEAARASGDRQGPLLTVADRLAQGDSIVEALQQTGDYFPPMFRRLAAVGEASGNLDRTYRRLADHYDRTLQAQRAFRGQLAWPLVQLGVALLVVGLLILIMGMLPAGPDGSPALDLLGFGLFGVKGLVVYVNVLVAAAVALLLVVESFRRGAPWARALQEWALRLPVVGGALHTLCLARFAWALQLVLDSPMDLRQALPLALDATGADYYARHGAAVARRIEQGATLHQALAATGAFPTELLDSIAVAEEAGALVETMQRESSEYERRAAASVGLLAQIAGYAVWLGVAGLIITLIFRIFTTAYLGPIRGAL
jgi:type II secretory pathway component PulF